MSATGMSGFALFVDCWGCVKVALTKTRFFRLHLFLQGPFVILSSAWCFHLFKMLTRNHFRLIWLDPDKQIAPLELQKIDI